MNSSVLIVEDEALVALEIQENVERLGHTVVDVSDTAEAAVKVALTEQPDLIIMDVRLKGQMDGVEAARLIRKSLDVPVIFLTAYSGDEILERATLAEPYGYLLKPVQEQQLASAMRVATVKHKLDSGRREGVKSLSAILRALPNAVIVTDMSLTVRYLNRKAEDLLGIPNQSAVRRPVKDIVRLGGTTLDRDGVEAFVEVLSDGRTVTLGEQTVTIEGAAPVQVRIEISPLADREGVINGAIVNMADLSGDLGTIKEARIEDEPTTLNSGDPVLDTVDLRSYLEVEIVRLTMDEGESQSTPRGFREGQITACKRILKYAFGDDALDDLESILPNARQ